MQQKQYQQIAIGAGLLAVVVAIATGRLPRWLRTTLVITVAALAGGVGLFAYRYVTNPITLTVAAGSLDGDVPGLWRLLRAEWLPRILRYVSKLSTKEPHWRLQRRFRRARSIWL